MLIQQHSTRLWITGLVCLVATSASAQERTAEVSPQDQQAGQIQPVIFWGGGVRYQASNNYHNPWNNYGPYQNVYPNYRDPSRGYVSFGYSHGGFGGDRWACRRNNCAANRANLGRNVRGGLGFLRPLTYWDAGAQLDIIALDPGYVHPNDVNQGYAAQGYGGPVSVPQAPNVRSNFNYGWGLPSSRLTPTSVPAGY